MTLEEFLRWGAQYKNFPYGQMAYWVAAAERQDGNDMYGKALDKK